MKKTIVLLCIMMITILLSAQTPPDTLWTRTYGRGEMDRCTSVQQTTDGGYIMVGRSKSSGDLNFDAWLIKTDANGDSLWSKTFGDYYIDEAYVVRQTSDGGYIIGGMSTQFGWAGEGWLIKTDDQGNMQWQNHYHADGTTTADWDYIYDLVITEDGSFVATGFTAITGYTHQGWILKTDSSGNIIWNRQYGIGAPYWDRLFDIKSAGDGDFIVSGDQHVNYSGYVKHDGWLMKIKGSDGDSLWAHTYGGSEIDLFRALYVNNDGTIIAGGQTESYGTSGYDAWLVKTDANGNEIWNNTYGEGAISTIIQTSEMYYVAGGMRFYPTTAYDGVLTKTYENGNVMWQDIVVRSNSDDMFESIEQTSDGGYIIGGRTNADANTGDYWLVKMSPDIVGDFNGDGYVDASDLQLFGDHWHFVETDPDWEAMYDLDPDGIIDAADLQIFGDHWHEGTPPTLLKGDEGKGPNVGAGIEFDLDATTAGNQHVTAISSQPAGAYIRLDVYATGVHNLDTYEFEIVYDASELDYISSSATNPLTFEGNILESEGGTAVGWMVDDSTPGILSIAYTLTGADTLEAPDGDGLLGDIVFQALETTHGMLSFGDVYYYDTFGVSDLITDTGTATLPVELSAFTATYNTTNGYTTLAWTTASENDVIGFNVYRSTEDEFDTSKKINAEIIAGQGTTTEINTYEFVDLDQLNFEVKYYYWLESVEFGGISIVYSSINITPEEGTGGFVDDFEDSSLSNYPNPFTNSTTISYSIKGMLRSQSVEINIYNMLGQLVDTVKGRNGTATWNTNDHATGIYFYKLNTESYTEIKKMMVTK
jgi:hypothetical protein